MDARLLKEMLEKVKSGEVPVDDAARRLAELPVQQIADFAQLDGERALRMGVPEVIFGERKRPEQIGALPWVNSPFLMAKPFCPERSYGPSMGFSAAAKCAPPGRRSRTATAEVLITRVLTSLEAML